MKKLLLLSSLILGETLHSDVLSDVLSPNKNLLFEYDFRINTAQSDILENSWISPIVMQYRKNFSQQFVDKTVRTGSFSVGIDQPIFKSGGIYYAIKYAQATRGMNEAQIHLAKRQLIAKAVKLLYEMKKMQLEQEKLAFMRKNDAIDILKKKEAYDAGLLDSSFLDQALIKQNLDETRALEIETLLLGLKKSFALISDKEPHHLNLPHLKLLSAEQFRSNNLELVRDKLQVAQKKYNAKMTWTKYLPTISIQLNYTNEDLNPLFPSRGIEESYFRYGFTITMPLNINTFSDIEASKVAYLKSQTELLDRKQTIDDEYAFLKKKLKIIDKKIALSKKDEALYKRVYLSTKNLVSSGEKTKYDSDFMLNSLKVKGIEKKIYRVDKQIELLALYAKVRDAI